MKYLHKRKLVNRFALLAGLVLAISLLSICGCAQQESGVYEEIIGYDLPTNALVSIRSVSRLRESEHSVLIQFPTMEAARLFLLDSKMKDVEGEGLRLDVRRQLDAEAKRIAQSDRPGLELPFERIVVGQSANTAFLIHAGMCSNYVLCIVK